MGVEEVQKVSVKVHLDAPGGFDPDPVIGIFARWRTDPAEEIVDLADYAHVAAGPAVVLVGKRYNLTLDTAGGRPGVQYSSKKGLEGSLEERIARVIRLALEKARGLLADPEFPPATRLLPGSLEIVLNDRLLAPNDDATDAAIRPELAKVLDRLYGGGRYSITRDPDPRHRLSYTVHCPPADGQPVESILSRLG